MKWLETIINRNKPQPPIQPVQVPTSELRLSDWRKNLSAVDAAKQLSSTTAWKTMLAILTNENPCHTVLSLGVSPNDRLVMQARIEGYEMCLNNLEAFTKPVLAKETLVPTFEPPQDEPRRKK